MNETEERSFEKLLEYIGRELDFESDFYNNAYLDRRITARMRRTDTDSYRAYQRLLDGDDDDHEAHAQFQPPGTAPAQPRMGP